AGCAAAAPQFGRDDQTRLRRGFDRRLGPVTAAARNTICRIAARADPLLGIAAGHKPHIGARLVRHAALAAQPIRQRASPALYAAAAIPRLPNRLRRSARKRAAFGIACSGSKGSARPRACAVSGMNCAIPWAPAQLTTPERKLLSRQMTRVTNS